jgi:hypothetical protein
MNHNLHVYAAGCAWSGPIEKVGMTGIPVSIPCCPYCGSVLFQMNEDEWWEGAEEFEKEGHPNYVAFLRWKESHDKCWLALEDAAKEYCAIFKVPVGLRTQTIEP